MHLELSKHVLGKKITPHYYSSDLKKEKKTKEIHNQKKKYTASRKEKEMEMKASQRKQFPSCLKEGVHVKQAKPSQQEELSWRRTSVQQSRDHRTSKSGGSLRVTEICLPIESQEINYTIHLCPYSPSGSKSTITQGRLQE